MSWFGLVKDKILCFVCSVKNIERTFNTYYELQEHLYRDHDMKKDRRWIFSTNTSPPYQRIRLLNTKRLLVFRIRLELNLYYSDWVGAVVTVVYYAIGFVIVVVVLGWFS